jgi:hypothetical protein
MSVSSVKLWQANSFDVFDFVVSCKERFNRYPERCSDEVRRVRRQGQSPVAPLGG